MTAGWTRKLPGEPPPRTLQSVVGAYNAAVLPDQQIRFEVQSAEEEGKLATLVCLIGRSEVIKSLGEVSYRVYPQHEIPCAEGESTACFFYNAVNKNYESMDEMMFLRSLEHHLQKFLRGVSATGEGHAR